MQTKTAKTIYTNCKYPGHQNYKFKFITTPNVDYSNDPAYLYCDTHRELINNTIIEDANDEVLEDAALAALDVLKYRPLEVQEGYHFTRPDSALISETGLTQSAGSTGYTLTTGVAPRGRRAFLFEAAGFIQYEVEA